MVPLVGNICTISTNLITNCTIGKEIGANGNTIGTNGTNVTNQWYHSENPEHTHLYRQGNSFCMPKDQNYSLCLQQDKASSQTSLQIKVV